MYMYVYHDRFSSIPHLTSDIALFQHMFNICFKRTCMFIIDFMIFHISEIFHILTHVQHISERMCMFTINFQIFHL